MDWKTMLAYISGSVDEELLLRNEYLVAENRILRDQFQGRLRLTDGQRRTLAEIEKRLGKQVLDEIARIVKPETILVLRAVLHAPGDAADSYCRRHAVSRRPVDEQVARNLTMADVGFLSESQYLIHDRDSKFCESFQLTLEAAGIKTVKLPARSPNLNSFAERWVRSAKSECLSKLILFGETSLRLALKHYVTHFHGERNHQGKGNLLFFPASEPDRLAERPIRCRLRLGGLLRFYHREAA